jgi:hypothetical protein
MYAKTVFNKHASTSEKPPEKACQLTQHHAEKVRMAKAEVGSAKRGTRTKALPGVEVSVTMIP